MHKNRQAKTRQDQIRLPRQIPSVQSESKSHRMKVSPHRQFRLGILAPNCRHHSRPDSCLNDVSHGSLIVTRGPTSAACAARARRRIPPSRKRHLELWNIGILQLLPGSHDTILHERGDRLENRHRDGVAELAVGLGI